MVATDHDNFDYNLIYKYSQLIIDSRGKYSHEKKVVKT